MRARMAEWQTRQFEGLLGDEPVRVQIPLLAPLCKVAPKGSYPEGAPVENNMSKLKVNKDFFNKWSPTMSYILGFIFADGCLVEHKNGYHGLDITSKDLKHLRLIKEQLKSEHKIGKKERGYRIQIRNRNIYNALIELGLTSRKSKTIKFPKIPIRYFFHFIRGLFDGDGSVFIWKEPRWRHTWQIRTTFCSGSLEFIKGLRRELFKNAGLSEGYLRRGSRIMELGYAIADSLKLYKFIYNRNSNLYLERKRKIFEAFVADQKISR